MVKVIRQGVYYMDGRLVKESQAFMTSDKKARAEKNTATYALLSSHRAGECVRLDLLAMEEEDYTGVIRTMDKLGANKFPMRTVLFAEEEGDYDFSLSAAKKFGAELVPADGASEQYLRERALSCGDLLLGASVYACGALGAMALTCGGGAVMDAALGKLPAMPQKPCVAVLFRGKPQKGVGPTDVALAVMRALARAGDFAQDKILECFGAGNLSMDLRVGIDVYLSELCYSTLWATDGVTREYLALHGREKDFKAIEPTEPAYYDGGVTVDLGKIEPMISLGGSIYAVEELLADTAGVTAAAEKNFLKENGEPRDFSYACRDGKVYLSSAYVERYLSSYETLSEMAEIVRGRHLAAGTACAVRPSSAAVLKAISESGALSALLCGGVRLGSADCACTGGLYACDDTDGEIVLDARTLAASLVCGGVLTPATKLEYNRRWKKYTFDGSCYEGRAVRYAPQGGDIDYVDEVPLSDMPALPKHLLLGLTDMCGEVPVYRGDALPGGTLIALAVWDEGEIGWADALTLRERGVLAVLSQEFSGETAENLLSWGILPLVSARSLYKEGHFLLLENVREVLAGEERVVAKVLSRGKPKDVALTVAGLEGKGRELALAGGILNVR